MTIFSYVYWSSRIRQWIHFVTLFVLCVVSKANAEGNVPEYGMDISYPIHHSPIESSEIFGTIQKTRYEEFLKTCRHNGGGELCDLHEEERLKNNRMQPPQMRNFTEAGFTKIKCPEKVFKLLKEFWQKNRHNQVVEDWARGNTVTNNWLTSSYMVSVGNESLIGGGPFLERQIWDAARDTMKEWTGQKFFRDSSLYGIRVYREGAILAPHVDRLPLVTSAIVCVDQDLSEPWPLEVYGHDGRAQNVTMLPGDLVLYESHSVVHGRPFPLQGNFMANIFIHFYPAPEVEQFNEDGEIELPMYILDGTAEADEWRKSLEKLDDEPESNGYTQLHRAAEIGDLTLLSYIFKKNPDAFQKGDVNGWLPLHFAIRAGRLEAIKFMVDHGADIVHYRTNEGTGYSAIELAKEFLLPEDPIILYLQGLLSDADSKEGLKDEL